LSCLGVLAFVVDFVVVVSGGVADCCFVVVVFVAIFVLIIICSIVVVISREDLKKFGLGVLVLVAVDVDGLVVVFIVGVVGGGSG
jgi:hypothetical protein